MSARVPLVRIQNLSYQYPRATELALREISLVLHRGEFLGIIGPTGAGKTTLCLTLNGIVPQFYGGRFFGHVSVAGLDSIETPIHRLAEHVAVVFQDPETQLVANSVEDEVAFALENLNVPRDEIKRRIPQALALVRLDGAEKKHPSKLSAGEKQRLAIAAALAMHTKVLVLDEPTSQLDPMGSQQVFATLRELKSQLGITIVLASHASEELAESVDRVALLDSGRLIDVDVPGRVFAQVDRLLEHAVRPPQVSHFFHALQTKGLNPPSIPSTFSDATQTYEAMHDRIDVHPPQFEALESADPRAPALISLRDVAFSYPDGTQALRGVSLDVRQGEYVIIVGQNGAGKTTLLKHLLHLLEPASGQVLLNGRDVRDLTVSEVAQHIGFVSQNPDNQIFTASIEEEVAFAPRNLGLGGAELVERVEGSLHALGLAEVRKRHPLSLPKGDRARVVIAAVLAMQPDTLVLDEPTTGQDYLGARRILEVTRHLHEAGKTVVVVTHHLHLMPGYAQRAVVMGKGVVALDAPIRQALHNTDVLNSTYLTPPQIVSFAQRIESTDNVALPILTTEELAACITSRGDPT